MRRFVAGLLLAGSAAAQSGPADAIREFKIDDAWGRDTVEFRSSAAVEEIVGTTNKVTGVLHADPNNLTGPATAARIDVRLSSFKTGVSMRDSAVAKALGADKHPHAVFTLEHLATASTGSLGSNVPVHVTAHGTLELNGVKRRVDVAADVTYIPKGGPFSQMRPGNFVKLVAHFDVPLSDFGVTREGPILPLQVAPTAHVTVMALASDASPAEAEDYRQKARKYMGKPAQ